MGGGGGAAVGDGAAATDADAAGAGRRGPWLGCGNSGTVKLATMGLLGKDAARDTV